MPLSDLLYPDNPKREKRAIELSVDITNSLSDLHKNKIEIDKALVEANELIKKEWKRFSKVPEEKEINLGEGWAPTVVDIIASIVAYKAAKFGLERASLTFLMRTGRIGHAAFISKVGLPKWFKVGSTAGAILAALAITTIVHAIFGAIRRGKLRDAIKELLPSRITFMRAQLVSDEVVVPLKVIIGIIKALEGQLPEEKLKEIIQNHVKKQNAALDAITDSVVKEKLKAIDKSRKSWTDED